MTLFDQIQQLVIKCIAREISVEAFREQFVPLFFAINRQSDIDAKVLADSIDNLYADVLIGATAEDEFRQKLAQLNPTITAQAQFEWAFQAAAGASGSPSVVLKTPTLESSSDSQLLQFA
jgi:hypothetical protein